MFSSDLLLISITFCSEILAHRIPVLEYCSKRYVQVIIGANFDEKVIYRANSEVSMLLGNDTQVNCNWEVKFRHATAFQLK